MPIPAHDELIGTWWRVPEHDTPGCRVYLREGQPVPPARGRAGLVLHADGTAVLLSPGADDRGQGRPSRWTLDANGLLQVQGSADASATVAEVTPHRLSLQAP